MADRPNAKSGISASPDDASGYRRGGGGARRRPGGGDGPRLIGMNLILALLVAGLVVAGWFIANQHQVIKEDQKTLAAAGERLALLEDRLRLTDETMTESGQVTKEKIDFWESEIRKLWAVSNERNKKWIQDSQADIAKLQKSMTTLEVSNRDLAAAVGRHETAFSQQQAIIDQLASIDLQMQQLVKTQRDLVDKVNAARQTVAGLESSLTRRVGDNEQAVAAIDAYRLQLNTRLADIERRLASLSGASTF